MATEDIKEFVQNHREYLTICIRPNWPGQDVMTEEIIRALDIANQVELGVRKMRTEKNCFDQFVDILSLDRRYTKPFLEYCLSDPPRNILKKIINSGVHARFVDAALHKIRDMYSEERLIQTLSDVMVEAASEETLLRNITAYLPADKVKGMNHQLYLFAVLHCDSDEKLTESLKNCGLEMLESLVLCLLKDNLISVERDKLNLIREKIITAFTNVMNCRDLSANNFWELLFNVEKENLIMMFLKHPALAEKSFEALEDRSRQIQNHSRCESCYIHLTEAQLQSAFKIIFQNETLKLQCINYMSIHGYESYILFQ